MTWQKPELGAPEQVTTPDPSAPGYKVGLVLAGVVVIGPVISALVIFTVWACHAILT